MAETLRDDPRTNSNWRTHRTACPNYRERWMVDTDLQAGEPLYQVFCVMNTPPTSAEEQHKCLHSHSTCWRLQQPRPARRAARHSEQQPNAE